LAGWSGDAGPTCLRHVSAIPDAPFAGVHRSATQVFAGVQLEMTLDILEAALETELEQSWDDL
jgi:hypothetical protein